MHSRERRVPRIGRQKVIPRERVKGIAGPKARRGKRLVVNSAAVGVCGFEVPLHPDVPVFVECELCGAGGEAL